ncbi:MAG: Lrp/AsnC family transcriptional regulator [Candidatus Bathyarchaeia archaeon]
MKAVESKLISELMKDSRRSDRELARSIGVSQPTVTRLRARLEKEKVIREYTVIPDFQKLGFKILAITSLAMVKEPDSKEFERALGTFSNILMFERGLGLKSSHMVVSLHEDFSSYAEFKRKLEKNEFWEVTHSASFLVNLNEDSGFLSFSNLAKELVKM